MRQGKISAGIAAIYDALNGALQWYITSPGRKAALSIEPGADMNDDRTVFRTLVRSGVLDGAFDFEAFDRLTERALHEELPGYDYRETLAGIESVMHQLGVMPFDESALPPEDPNTF